MAQKLSTLANEIWPLLLPRIQKMVADAGASGGGAAQLAAHDLSGSLHKGTLADAQFPQGLLRNGSRSLAGNLSVDAGVTIDGVDLDAHAANPDAHHARAHVLATAAGLGADHSMSGAAAGQTLRANSATNAMWAYLSHTDLTGVTADQHHAKQHDIVDAANHTVAGAAWSVVGATALNTLGLMLARSDATGTPKETLLKSDASGYLNLVRLIASDRLRASLVDTASGDMSITPAGDLTLNPTGGEIFIPGADTLRSTAWTPGLLGTGWGIQERAGQAGKSHLDIRSIYTDELIATTFTADQVRVRSGSDWLGESLAIAARDNSDAKVTIPNVGGGAVRIYVENAPEITGQIFDANEYVLIKTVNRSSGIVIRETWGRVSSYIAESGNRQSYSWTTVDGGGNFTLEPGTALTGFGVNAGSFIFRTVVEAGRGPYERFATWATNPYTPGNRTSRVEIGDLRNAIGDATTRYGIAAGNNLALTPTTGFAGFAVDSVYGARLYSTAIALYSGSTQTVNISNTGADIWVGPSSSDKRINWDGTTLRLKGNLVIANSSNADVIALDNAGNSYFAGIMTIGTGGEIRQGTGTLGSNYTGLRIWRDTNVGRIGGYNADVLQWYAGTDGYLYAGGGAAAITRYGYMIQDTPNSPSFTWPFLWGGLHAVNDITTPGTGWKSSLMFGEPTLVYSGSQRFRGWLFQFAGDLLNPPVSGDGSTADYALTIQDEATHVWKVWHQGNDGAGSGLDAGMLNGLGLGYAGNRWGVIAFVDGAAFMDVGGYINFHASDADMGAYNLRLDGGMTYTAGLGITNAYGYVAVGPNNASYCHFQTDRPAYYFDHPLVITNSLSSYNNDLALKRNGTTMLEALSWGVYAHNNLSLDNVLGIYNVQASKPANPATGCKIYLRDAGAGVHLYVLYPSGTETRLD